MIRRAAVRPGLRAALAARLDPRPPWQRAWRTLDRPAFPNRSGLPTTGRGANGSESIPRNSSTAHPIGGRSFVVTTTPVLVASSLGYKSVKTRSLQRTLPCPARWSLRLGPRGSLEAFASRLLGIGVTRNKALESLVIASLVRGLSIRYPYGPSAGSQCARTCHQKGPAAKPAGMARTTESPVRLRFLECGIAQAWGVVMIQPTGEPILPCFRT